MERIYRAIGLMSGTSMDGIDLALIESKGSNLIRRLFFEYIPYKTEFKNKLRDLIFNGGSLIEIKLIERELTLLHADFVDDFLARNQIDKASIDLIGFHGHTIIHSPKQKITWQLGDEELLEKQLSIKVIKNFRTQDILNGGQGAPLVPIYHFYLFQDYKPALIVNIGGVCNATFIDSILFDSKEDPNQQLEASDICFGNAPIDDLVRKTFGLEFDKDGIMTNAGRVHQERAEEILSSEFFKEKFPKSFDRNDFAKALSILSDLQPQDAMATMANIIARSLKSYVEHLNYKPKHLILCGGGVKNLAIVNQIKNLLEPKLKVMSAGECGFNPDSIEAEAFAFMAIRRHLSLPISFTNTTGINS